MQTIEIRGRSLEFARLASAHPRRGAPPLVFLHEGLGSLAMWRDFPQQVADATGCEAVVYSRYGYGRSTPLREPRQPGYMHDEALLDLPRLLDTLALEAPILFGHSDGASIALIHAGHCRRALTAVIAMAPHVLVEPISIESIARAKTAYERTDLASRLQRYHDDVDSAFLGWNRIWLSPGFRDWNIEDCLPRIGCPVLAIQGEDDEYGTMEQVERIARQARDVDLVRLADCRHSPHRDQPQAVIEAVSAFIARILD